MATSALFTPAVPVVGSRSARRAATALLTETARRSGPRIDVASLLGSTTTETLTPLAAYHRTGGLLYETLRLTHPDHPAATTLEKAYRDATRIHMRMLWTLERLVPTLNATARWAVIKGPVLVERLYGNPGRRPYLDLDLLVEPKRLRHVVEALESTGAVLVDRNWVALRREVRGEVHLVLPGGIPLDLHWNLINMNRRRMWVDTRELLDRVAQVDLGATVVPTLDAADTVLHLAFHAGLAGGDRLIWMADVDRAIATGPPPWDELLERARRWGVAPIVGLMLERAAVVLGAPVPAYVRTGLVAPGTLRLMGLIDRLSPWELAVGRLTTLSLMLSRSAGHGFRGGLSWLAQRAVRNLDPREPEASSVLTPRGDDGDRAAFFDAVARMGGG